MMLLTSTSDLVQLVTGSAINIAVHATYVDNASGTITPCRTNTLISGAATTTIVASPASSTQRNVKMLNIRNTGASSDAITVQHTDGTNVVALMAMTLQAGEALTWNDIDGWTYFSASGAMQVTSITQGTAAFQSASPTGGVSTTEKAMGLGSTFVYTPSKTGNLIVLIAGMALNYTAAGDGTTIRGRYGTGTAPTNGATSGLGTQFSIDQHFVGSTTAGQQGFNVIGKITGQTIGTAMWFDLSLLAVTGGGSTVKDVQFVIIEVQ